MTQRLRPIQSTEDFAKLEGAWNDLLSRSAADTLFLTWEWLWTWWRIYARTDDRLAILVLERDGGIAGIAPFYVRTKRILGAVPVRQLMFLGTQEPGPGDVFSEYQDIFCLRGEERCFVDALYDYIVGNRLSDELLLFRMDLASATFNLLRESAAARGFLSVRKGEYTSPCIKLPSSWDAYLNGLSSSMRHKIRSERRKLQALQDTVFRKAEKPIEVKAAYEALISLHQARWEAKGERGSFANRKFVEFHASIMDQMLTRGCLDLVLLSEGGKPRAAAYNFRYKNKVFFYQSGVDTRPGAPAFGYLLHGHCIESAIRDGLDEYDFLMKGPDDNYKDRFSNSSRHLADVNIVHNRFVAWFVAMDLAAHRAFRLVKRLAGLPWKTVRLSLMKKRTASIPWRTAAVPVDNDA